MKKILITGCSGMLGNVLGEECLNKYKNVIGIDLVKPNNNVTFFPLDLTQSSKTNLFLEEIKPDVIIHTAAFTNVDFCEKNHEITDKLHIEAPRLLANYCNSKAKLIFISTDSVFPGDRGNYKEEDQKNPINYYAKTKDLAEEIIKSTCDNYIIARTNIFGFHQSNGSSLVEWALSKLTVEERINGFSDIYFNAIYTRFLSQIIIEMIELNLNGTYHICSKDAVSKFEFLKLLASIFKLNPDLIAPVKVDDLKMDTSRPKNTTLNTDKIRGLIKLPTIEEGLWKLYEDYLNKINH